MKRTGVVLAVAAVCTWLVACQAQNPDTEDVAAGTTEFPAPVSTQAPVSATAYDCDDGTYVVASFREGDDDMWLFLPGRTVNLAHQPSASGARYSDGEVEFWSKGYEAVIEYDDGVRITCDENRRASILETIKLNGGDFWATGNEPGWNLELYPGRFVFVTNYGEERYEGPMSAPEEDKQARTTVFRTLGEGIDLQITLIGVPCADTMADEDFPTRVEVRFGDVSYSGCGQALH